MDEVPITTLVGSAGLAIGIAFGAVTRRADFCALGAIADIEIYGDFRRLRSWLMAIATAMVGTHLLHWFGSVDMYQSIYLGPDFGWFGTILGGLTFGYGTVMARGCGGRSLIRFAGGDLRALVTLLFLGIFAYMTLRGFTGLGRNWLEGIVNMNLAERNITSQGIPELLGAAFGLDSVLTRTVLSVLVTAFILWFCLKDKSFRTSAQHLGVGVAIGVLVIAGWGTTGILGADDFEPVALASMTFVRPIGDSIQYLMTFTGATVTFGVAVVGGTVIGGFIIAVFTGTFRLVGFSSAAEMPQYMIGGTLMGVGGVLALGCTIGQGITGVSTLSLGSLLALTAIVSGGLLGISRLGLDTANEGLG